MSRRCSGDPRAVMVKLLTPQNPRRDGGRLRTGFNAMLGRPMRIRSLKRVSALSFYFGVLLLLLSGSAAATFEEGAAAEKSGDSAAAFCAYYKAADLGDARAQSALGRMYADGRGVASLPRAGLCSF